LKDPGERIHPKFPLPNTAKSLERGNGQEVLFALMTGKDQPKKKRS